MYTPQEEPNGRLLETNGKFDHVEVKIIVFLMKPGRKSTSTIYEECEIKVICQVI